VYNAICTVPKPQATFSPKKGGSVTTERGQPGQRVQLHRALSKLGWGSRKQAWAWIRAGEVHVDGRVVTDPLAWIDLGRQRLRRAGHEAGAAPVLALALNKPRGVVTSRRDEHGRRTVYDLLPPDLPWVFPAGRLDADSEGLLILTNDSALAVRLTEPEHHVPKTYHVTVAGRPSEEVLRRLREGVELADSKTRPAKVRLLRAGEKTSELEIVLTEGRNRQVRRMTAAVGHKTRRLVRVAIGGYGLADLAVGAHRRLEKADARRLLERA
jgi:23S rRNA pseudouridine2605 synthase